LLDDQAEAGCCGRHPQRSAPEGPGRYLEVPEVSRSSDGTVDFGRFADRTLQALLLVQVEAQKLGCQRIAPEHLLLGLIAAGSCTGVMVLRQIGVPRWALQNHVRAVVREGEPSTSAKLPYTPEAKAVIELAVAQADELGDRDVGTEHLLLALVRLGEGHAYEVLALCGVNYARVRAELVHIRQSSESSETPVVPPKATVGPGQGHRDGVRPGTDKPTIRRRTAEIVRDRRVRLLTSGVRRLLDAGVKRRTWGPFIHDDVGLLDEAVIAVLPSLYMQGARDTSPLLRLTDSIRTQVADHQIRASLLLGVAQCHAVCGEVDACHDLCKEASSILDRAETEGESGHELLARWIADLSGHIDPVLRDHNLERTGSVEPRGDLIDRTVPWLGIGDGTKEQPGAVLGSDAKADSLFRTVENGLTGLTWHSGPWKVIEALPASSASYEADEIERELADQTRRGEWPYARRVLAFLLIGRIRRIEGRWDQAKDALFVALETAKTLGSEWEGVLGIIEIEQVLLCHAHGDLMTAKEMLPHAARRFMSIRLSIATPMVRSAASINLDRYAQELLALLGLYGHADDLASTIEGLAAHGLADLLRDEDRDALSGPGYESGDPAQLLTNEFRAAWDPAWCDMPAFRTQLGSDQRVHQLTTLPLLGSELAIGLVGTLIGPDEQRWTMGHGITADQRRQLRDWNLRTVTHLRGRDWQAFAGKLLPEVWGTGNECPPARIVFVPGEELAQLPFAALPVSGGCLGDLSALQLSPSLAVWAALPADVVLGGRDLLLVGADQDENPKYGVKGLALLVDSMADLGLRVKVVASLEELRRSAPGASAVLLAVHGSNPKDPDGAGDRNGLWFPDGALVDSPDLREVAWPPIVVSTTCWSGALVAHPSPLALLPSLLTAGVGAMVVSLWDGRVDAGNAVALGLFRHLLDGQPVSDALVAAQREPSVSRFGVHRWALAAVAR
jgi:hypothetical protein